MAFKFASLTALLCCALLISGSLLAQNRRRPRPPATQTQAPKGSAAKYSVFQHSSEKHKSLTCDACHKIPTAWNAKRDFPDVADSPGHDACVRCHRSQFFSGQAMSGSGPAICTVCHLRAAPREAARFAFGKPNAASQTLKSKDERQFTIEFPHDKHQNVIANLRPRQSRATLLPVSFAQDTKKPDYNNCTICHRRNDELLIAELGVTADPADQSRKFFKTVPHSHDACFGCHWKNEKPVNSDCAGCHKAATPFVPLLAPRRISARFSHEGGKGEHVLECPTCHINITRAATVRGLTPDVPIAACTTCHQDNKKTTYPKVKTIEEEFAQYQKTKECVYCHTSEVGSKKPPASHDAAAQ
ncbi:MAG TPA: hypothetical protein VE961_23720 [Pyrinomonadaceae bacterium]|nr:hypothetical protein [Pyrinomonadaceae bacterium]